MILKILLPSHVFLEKEVKKIIAEGPLGFFCLLPRHVDFVAVLVPGIFMLINTEDQEEYYALGPGSLVKTGRQVLVSIRDAVKGESLEELKDAVEEKFFRLQEQEEGARRALSKLEADTIRRFMDLGGKDYHGFN